MIAARPQTGLSLPEAGGAEARALRGAAWRIAVYLVAPLALGFMLLLLDRAAVSHVGPSLGAALGLDAFQVGLTTPILFLGILLFEVPSALIAGRVGTQRWLAATLITWGMAGVATGLASGPVSFYAARCVASLAQAGFFPVAVYLIASYAPARFRTRLMAAMVLIALAAAVLAQPLSTLLLGLDGVAGMSGWRWLFLALGLPCLPLAALVLHRMPDQPRMATWLSPAQRDALSWSRSVETRDDRHDTGWTALIDPRLLMLAGINFALSVSAFAAGTFYAALMQDSRAPVGALQLIFVVAIIATTLIWARAADRSHSVFEGLTISVAVATVAYAAGVFRGPVASTLVGLMAHIATLGAARCMIWSAAGRLAVMGPGGAAALAIVDASGIVAAFMAPRLIAGLAQQSGSLEFGLVFVIALLAGATGLAVLLRQMARAG